jgi:hypothetical protein
MTAIHESYFHTADPATGGLVRTHRLRSVDRTADDGRKLRASKRGDDGINLQLESRGGSRVEDVLNAEERVILAKLLLSDLPLDLARNALPGDLFTAEWALRTTDADPNEIIGEPGGGYMPDRAAAEAAAADLAETFEDPAVVIVRREITDWIEVD